MGHSHKIIVARGKPLHPYTEIQFLMDAPSSVSEQAVKRASWTVA